MSKFEKLLDLLVNEQKDEAEKLFHEIVVEKSRSIYEGILADEEAETTEESADNVDADEVDEAKHKDKKAKDKEEMKEDEAEEEPAESTDETIEEIGGDATDDLISDIEAEADGMDDMEMSDDEGEEEEEEGEAEEMFEPLEKELDALKAEFAKMMDEKDEEPEEESFEPELDAVESEELEVEESESKDADTLIKEYSEMVSSGHGAEKMGSEKNADHKASPVAKSNKPVNTAGAHKMDQGGEGKGGVGKALTGDTAKDMGVTAKNEPGIKSAKLDNAPKAQEKEGSVDGKSPVASK